MARHRIVVGLMLVTLAYGKIVPKDSTEVKTIDNEVGENIEDVFNGVYTDCFARFSFACVQRKTLMYLKHLDSMSEVSLLGDYVKFVKLNTSKLEERTNTDESTFDENSEELTQLIDKQIDRFFDNHVVRFSALGRDISMPSNVEEFVGRKKRKGGGGGGEVMMSGHGGGHFGSKKMMMMAMVCMKMKMMMMLPAMMGMMGMMSFKGMMFSMMSFMLAKMMLLMKLLEKKGGGGGGVGTGADGGWAAAGGGGGAWMPAGGQDYGGGGGYDANGQWQSRSILENHEEIDNKPVYSYIAPVVTYNKPNMLFKATRKNDNIANVKNATATKSRKKRSIIDVLQNSYTYWMNRLLGVNNNRRTSNFPKYKIVNGVKYVFYPYRQQKYKMPKEIQTNKIKNSNEEPVIITAEDFNKGEIIEGGVESRMNRKSMMEMKDAVNETLDDNPWE